MNYSSLTFITTVFYAVCLLGLCAKTDQASLQALGKNTSQTGKYRISWSADPSQRAVIAWHQKRGTPGVLHYGKVDQGRNPTKYPNKRKIDRIQFFHGMANCFVRLSNLEPDTDYFFVIQDQAGVSPRFVFKTAPNLAKTFTFISGGDSRNGRAVRQAANELAAKLQPLFIAFTGDMVELDNAVCWSQWLDDWQKTVNKHGRMIPIVAHRGNHESLPDSIYKLFDTPKNAYYSFSVGGNLLRYYALNSMLPAFGKQGKWLAKDLAVQGIKHTHLVAGYHHPMRPHFSKKPEGNNPYHWAATFYKYGVDLALESDSHVLKRTMPLKPTQRGEEGFIAAPKDKNATIFTGEGCWGAPLRAADDAKSWTLDCTSANGFDWIQVSPQQMQLKTVLIHAVPSIAQVSDFNSFTNPKNLQLWQAKGGEVLTIPAD